MDFFSGFDKSLLFILLVFPGLVSMQIYRLLLPAKSIEWKTAPIEALFYSIMNFALCLPLLVFVHQNGFYKNHPYWYSFVLMVVLLVTPLIWPIVYAKAIRCKKLMVKMQLPFPTAWDYYFDKRHSVWVLAHLKDGTMIGGLFGGDSYATSFPNDGDIFLEKVAKVSSDGAFEKMVEDSAGMLLKKDSYDFLEFFHTEQEASNEQ